MLTGCYHQSLSLVGPAAGASQGKVTQSYLSTALNYAIKEKTGKNTLEHVFTREKEKMAEASFQLILNINQKYLPLLT